MGNLWQDIRYSARMLLKKPAFTIVAVVTLALGIGANTAIFTVANAVLLGSLPYRNADRLATVWESHFTGTHESQNTINLGNFFDWKEQNTVFEDMAAYFDNTINLTGDGEPEEVPRQIATTNLFSLLGVDAMIGRTFDEDDGKPGRERVAVISYSLWQRRFGGDQTVVGRKVRLNNLDTTIVGVLPPSFSWHIRKGSMTRKKAEIWSPWQVSNDLRQRQGRFACAVARLKPGVTRVQAQADMDRIAAQLSQQYPDFDTNWGVNVVPLRDQFTGEIKTGLWVLIGAVGFVLLIACANVANLLLARAASRQKEIAVRVALGAGRWRIVRQLLTESVLLSSIGGAIGVLLAWWGTDALIALSPAELIGFSAVRIDSTVLLFTVGVSVLTGILFGLAPAFDALRQDIHSVMKESGKNTGGSARSHRIRSGLVVSEFALALVLLVGAGLLIKSFGRLMQVDLGFNSTNLLTMKVSLPLTKYADDRKCIDFIRQTVEGLRDLPGVEAVGAINWMPFAGPHAGTGVHIEGAPELPSSQQPSTGVCVTDAGYFAAMQIPLKRGRLFTDREASDMRHVVVVNEKFVEKLFPDEDPLGKRVTIDMKDENAPCEIIGVVGDTKHLSVEGEPEPMAYWPHPELVYSSMYMVIRTSKSAATMAPGLREVISRLDPDQPIADIQTMDSLVGKSVARSRFSMIMLGVFAGLAMLLAAIGIYGVMAYAVAQRTQEIGVRMALGAQKKDVLVLVVRRGMALAMSGVGIGLAGSYILTRVMKSLLYEVSATDTVTFVATSILLVVVAWLACYVPGVRATRVDPMSALRYE